MDRCFHRDLTIDGMAQDVAKLLEQNDIKDAVLCGHGMGMRVVLEVHALVPERVTGCVLIDGSSTVAGNLDDVLGVFDRIANIPEWIQGLFDEMFLTDTHLDQQRTYRDRIAAMPADTLKTVYRNMILWDGLRLSDRLKNLVDKPLLVLQSTIRSGVAVRCCLRPAERGAFIEMLDAAHPNCCIVTYTDASHFINLDKPAQMKQDILSWCLENHLERQG